MEQKRENNKSKVGKPSQEKSNEIIACQPIESHAL